MNQRGGLDLLPTFQQRYHIELYLDSQEVLVPITIQFCVIFYERADKTPNCLAILLRRNPVGDYGLEPTLSISNWWKNLNKNLFSPRSEICTAPRGCHRLAKVFFLAGSVLRSPWGNNQPNIDQTSSSVSPIPSIIAKPPHLHLKYSISQVNSPLWDLCDNFTATIKFWEIRKKKKKKP